MSGFNAKRVLVTGAASGIGAATCTLLAEVGCRIAAIDRHVGALIERVTQLRNKGHMAVAAAADVGSWEDVERAVTAAAQELGGWTPPSTWRGSAATPGMSPRPRWPIGGPCSTSI